jgi:hypothetical protein
LSADISIAAGIIIIFVLVGTLLPFVREGFGDTSSVNGSVTTLTGELAGYQGSSSLTIWGVFGSIFKMFFWTFGALWWPIDLLFFVPMRILLVFILARNLWGVAS